MTTKRQIDHPSGASLDGPAIDLSGAHLLVVDDDPVGLLALKHHLTKLGAKVTTATDGPNGIKLICPNTSVALINLRMPRLDGMKFLSYVNQHHSSVQVIITTASDDVQSAVAAMAAGAFQYVIKPFQPTSLSIQVKKAHEAWGVSQENQDLRKAVCVPELPAKLLDSEAQCNPELSELIEQIAMLDSTAFISGESGTGKTTVARLIHQTGPRRNGPFVAINCASLPRELIESELFGHSRGAFTGAVKDRIGKAEVAHTGTLFLDEIGDLPIDLQPKLLTFLQDRTLQRVGCNIDRTVDVRLIVATHRNLAQMCLENRFREDLYYRLNVLSLDLPPLRGRVKEIPQIANSIVRSICQRQKRDLVELHAESLTLLQSHPWRGNIREMENVLERAIAFTNSSTILPAQIQFDRGNRFLELDSAPVGEQRATTLAGMTLEAIEIQAIIETIQMCGGNKAKSARMLGISEKSIYNKIRRHGIDLSTVISKAKS